MTAFDCHLIVTIKRVRTDAQIENMLKALIVAQRSDRYGLLRIYGTTEHTIPRSRLDF